MKYETQFLFKIPLAEGHLKAVPIFQGNINYVPVLLSGTGFEIGP